MSQLTAGASPVRFIHGTPPSGDERRAVVVGGGFGGLALAVRLQAAGLAVTLVERRPRLGGRAYRLEEGGYVFDMGPSLVTAPDILDDLFRAAGSSLHEAVDLVPLDPYYRIHFDDGTVFDYSGDPERMKVQMRRLDPWDADRYDGFMDAIRPIHEAVIDEGLGRRPFDRLSTMAGFIPRMVGLGAHRSAAAFVARWFRDPRHRFLFSFHPLFVGGNPFHTPAVYLMIPWLERRGGVWFARGGMYALVEALEARFRALGGVVRTGTPVEEVLVEGGRARGVRLEDGTRLSAEVVASNADVAHTYRDLVPAEARRRWTDRRLERQAWTMSCVVLYMGVRRTYPDLAHHTLVLSPRYRELLDDIFRRKILPPDFSLYLHAPTRTDPSMAPPGCESLYALVPVANNASGIDWRQEGGRLAERVMAYLEAWGLPGLRDHLDVLRIFTPDDFESELNAFQGNAFGLEPRLTQTGWLRPHNRSEDVDGLYLVGAGTHPGAGVPGVLLSAEATFACVAEDLGLQASSRPSS